MLISSLLLNIPIFLLSWNQIVCVDRSYALLEAAREWEFETKNSKSYNVPPEFINGEMVISLFRLTSNVRARAFEHTRKKME